MSYKQRQQWWSKSVYWLRLTCKSKPASLPNKVTCVVLTPVIVCKTAAKTSDKKFISSCCSTLPVETSSFKSTLLKMCCLCSIRVLQLRNGRIEMFQSYVSQVEVWFSSPNKDGCQKWHANQHLKFTVTFVNNSIAFCLFYIFIKNDAFAIY